MTDYHKTFIPRVRDLGYLGASDTEMCHLLGISTSTLKAWLERYPEFAAAYDDGRMRASAKVAASLFKRATGYDYMKVKDTPNGTIRETMHVEASVDACKFWLVNKAPDQWKMKVEHELSSNGTTIDSLSEIEAARRIAFALAKAMVASEEQQQRGIEHGERSEPETK